MIYELTIEEQNKKAHVDIEDDIKKQRDGLFTFTLRVNHGNIIDYTVTEYANAAKYLRLESIIIEQLTVSLDPPARSNTNAVRTDNS